MSEGRDAQSRTGGSSVASIDAEPATAIARAQSTESDYLSPGRGDEFGLSPQLARAHRSPPCAQHEYQFDRDRDPCDEPVVAQRHDNDGDRLDREHDAAREGPESVLCGSDLYARGRLDAAIPEHLQHCALLGARAAAVDVEGHGVTVPASLPGIPELCEKCA